MDEETQPFGFYHLEGALCVRVAGANGDSQILRRTYIRHIWRDVR